MSNRRRAGPPRAASAAAELHAQEPLRPPERLERIAEHVPRFTWQRVRAGATLLRCQQVMQQVAGVAQTRQGALHHLMRNW